MTPRTPRKPAVGETASAAEPDSPDAPDTSSDAALVRSVLDGRREDFGRLVRRYQERFHRFALGMVNDRDQAADLVQDAFVKAYSNLASCHAPERFESWSYQILRNLCRDHLKDLRRGHRSLDEAGALPTTAGRPGQELERSELRRTLRVALASLPDTHREAFLLKHLEGYSYPEISHMTGASVSAVKMRVHRSREALRECLGTDEDGDRRTTGHADGRPVGTVEM